jgi:hypothetical protein
MGLDLVPMGRPKRGFERRFREIWNILESQTIPNLSFFQKILGKEKPTEESLLKELEENSILSYETIQAPQVGRDKEANEWAKKVYEQGEKEVSFEEFFENIKGYRVIQLAKEQDGVPVYISPTQDENVFRGEFLKDCVDIIGEEILEEAWGNKFADEALDYGNRIMSIADKVAKENNLEHLKDLKLPPENVDEESMEFKLHILYSLAKWLIFYGKNGHGYIADF